MKRFLNIYSVIGLFLLILAGLAVYISLNNKDKENNDEIEYYQDEGLKPIFDEIRQEEEENEKKIKEEREKSEQLSQYAAEGRIKEWEELSGRKFTLNDYVDFDVKVKGYLVQEEEEMWGENVTIAYFVITEYSDDNFKNVLEDDNKVYIRNNNNNFFELSLGCVDNQNIKNDGKGDAGIDYLTKDVAKSILNSSEDRPIEIVLNFRERAGFGCLCCNAPYQIKKVE